MSQNLIMVDHAKKDPRSVSAMLAGSGDSREAYWLEYVENRPHIFDMEFLMESYGYAIKNGLARPIPQPEPLSMQKVMLIVFGIIFFIVF